jgi:glycosyltransferase involved in cell wall biosynthesis
MAVATRPVRPGSTATAAIPRLRVAHVTANFADGSGGITLREALALDPGRFSSTIIAPADGTLFGRAEAAGLEVVRLQRMGRGRRVYPWADVEALRELEQHLHAGRYGVVHTHAGRAGAIGRVAAHRVGGAAVVHTLHGFPFNEFQPLPVRRTLQAIERRLGRITHYFLTDGTFVASEAVRLRIARPERVRAVISPIDPVPQTTPERRRAARRALGVPEDVRLVGTAARLAAQKAPLDMVTAIAMLPPDVHMVWLGDGDLREATRRSIEHQGLADRFVLAGEREDVAELLPALDVFAMSSLWEGLPCGLVEAMTCGVPVVATAVNSVPEIVVSGRTGILARPGDPRSLAGALAYLLDRPEEASRMAEAAHRHVGEQFRPDLLGTELAAVYDRARAFATSRESVRLASQS